MRAVTEKDFMALKNGTSWDWQSSSAVDLPESLDRALGLEESDSTPVDKKCAPLRWVSVEAQGSALTGFEVLNAGAASAGFVSSQAFDSGVHWFELRHFSSFKNVRIGVVPEKGDAADVKTQFTFEQPRSLLLKLSMSKSTLTAYTREGLAKKTLPFKNRSCKLFVGLGDVGNFVGLNPFAATSPANPAVVQLLDKLDQSRLKKLKEWSFISNFNTASYENSLEKFLNGGLKAHGDKPLIITDHVYDPELQVIAFKRNGNKHGLLQNLNKLTTFVSAKELFDLYHSDAQDPNEKNTVRQFYRKHKQRLHEMDSSNKYSLKTLADALRLSEIKRIKSSQPPANALVKYLPFADALLISNGANKAKLVFDRDSAGRFIVSPHIFETRDIHCYLDAQEFHAIFCQIDWLKLEAKSMASNIEKIARTMQRIKESAVATDQYVFFTSPATILQSFVELLFEHLREKLDTDEDSVDEKAQEQENNITECIADLFQEGVQRRTSLTSPESNSGKPNLVNYPSRTDVAFNALLKIEEALYQQNAKYRNCKSFPNRAHTAHARLFSFTEYHMPQHVRTLLDSGLYVDSSMEGELRAFLDEKTGLLPFDSSELRSAELVARFNAVTFSKHIIPLNFSLSHARAEIFWNNLHSLEVADNGKFVIAVDKTFQLRLYSIQFGFTKLFERQLRSNAAPNQLPGFETFLEASGSSANYFALEEIARYKSTGAAATAPKTPSPQDPNVDENMLDQLYKMGFSLELAKKALLEVKSSSLDAAVNVILTYEAPPSASKPTTTSALVLKPEWHCGTCTFINQVTSSSDEAHICQMCGSPAGPDAYFEEKAVEKEAPAPVAVATTSSAKSSAFPALCDSDTITKVLLFQNERDNGLNSFVLLVFYRTAAHKSNILTIRLAYNPTVIKRALIVDGKGECQSSSWLGKTPLHSKQEEKELSTLFKNAFFSQVHSLLPEFFEEELLVVSSSKVAAVEHNLPIENGYVFPTRETNGRLNEVVTVVLFNPTSLLKLKFANKSKTYKNDEYELSFENYQALDANYSFAPIENSLFIFNADSVRTVEPKNLSQKYFFEAKSGKILSLHQLSKENFAIICDQGPSEIKRLQEASEEKQEGVVAAQESVLKPVPQKDAQSSPKFLLSALKKSLHTSVRVTQKKNVVSRMTTSSAKHCVLDVCDPNEESAATLQFDAPSEIIHVCVDAFVSILKNDVFAAELPKNIAELKPEAVVGSSNTYSTMPLIALEFKGSRFSKSLHISKVLFKDAEFYSTNTYTNLFVFENAFERVMNIRKVNITMNESFVTNGPVSDLAVFIFNELAVAGELQKYRSLTKQQFAAVLATNQLVSPLKPALLVDFAKLGSASVSAELENDWAGRYVAFLPLRKSATVNPNTPFSIDYFGVEGEYLNDSSAFSEKVEPRDGQVALLFPAELSLSSGEQKSRVQFKVRNFHERGEEILLSLTADTLISSKGSSEVTLSIAPLGHSRAMLKLLPRLFAGSDSRAIKIKEEILSGQFTSIEAILKDYHARFMIRAEDADFDQENLEDFLRLMLHLFDVYGKPLGELIGRVFDWNKLFVNHVYNVRKSASTRLLGLFVERLASIDQNRVAIKLSIRELLQKHTDFRTSPRSQKLLWHLIRMVLSADKTDQSFKTFLAEYFVRVLNKIHTLYSYEQKVLDIVQVPASLNGVFLEEQGVSVGDAVQSPANIPSLIKQPFTGFELSASNTREYYVLFNETLELSSITATITGVKFNEPFTVELFTPASPKHFALARTKSFDQSFCHQIIKQEKTEGVENFGFGFWTSPLKARLLRILVKFNYIASFHYSNVTTPPNFTFNFYGSKAAGQSPFEEPLLFGAIRDELGSAAKPVQSLPTQAPAATQPAAEKTGEAVATKSNEVGQLEESREAVLAAVARVSASELSGREEAARKLESVVGEYKRICEHFARVLLENPRLKPDYKENYAFWLAVATEFSQNITLEMSGADIAAFFAETSRVDVVFHLVYDLFVFDANKKSSLADLRTKIIAQLTPDEHKTLLNRLVAEFLKEPEPVFLSHFQAFVDRLASVELVCEKWNTLLADLAKMVSEFDHNDDKQWEAFYIRFLLLGKKVDAMKGAEVSNDARAQVVSLILFLLDNDLVSSCARFKDVLHKLVERLASDIAVLDAARVNELRPVILGLHRRKLLELLDPALEELERKALAQAVSHTRLAPTQAAGLEQFCTLLTELASGEGRAAQPEATTLLVFCLSHLKRAMEVLTAQYSGDAGAASRFLLPADFLVAILALAASMSDSNEKLITLIVQLAIDENLTQKVFQNLMSFFLALPAKKQQFALETISQSFTEFFAEAKNPKTQTELAPLLLEFNTQMVQNDAQMQKLLESVPLTDLCIMFALFIINLASSLHVANDKLQVPLRPTLFQPLFFASTRALVRELNFGGADNFLNFPRDRMSFLELTSHHFCILARGQLASAAPFHSVLLGRAPDAELLGALDSLVQWLMLNYNVGSTDFKTPAGNLVKKLFNDAIFLFKAFFKDEELSKALINSVCRQFQALYDALHQKVEAKKTGYMTLLLLENSIEFFESLLEDICASPKQITHFLHNNKGLEMIFTLLNSVASPSNKPLEGSSLPAKLRALRAPEKAEEAAGKSKTVFSVRTKAEFEVEVANNLKLCTEDKALQNSSNKEWQANKTGKNGNLYNTQFPNNRKSIRLRFRLANKTELRNVKVGVLVYRSDNHLVVGSPSYMRLNGYYDDEKGVSQKVYLGEFTRLEDSGYTGFCTEVYGLNLNKLVGRDCLAAVGELKEFHELTDFELIVGRPLVSVVDKISPYFARCNTPVHFTLNFVSAEGFSHAKIDLPLSFARTVENTFYNFIQALFNSDAASEIIDAYLDGLPKPAAEALFASIESQLDPIMNNFQIKMSKFLMTISQKNKKMSVSIFRFLKKNLEKNDLFYALIEKILARTHSHAFFLEFFEFGATKMNDSPAFGNKFLEVLCKYMLELSKHLGKGSFPVPLTRVFFQTLLRKYCEQPFNFNYECAIVLTIQLLHEQKVFAEFDPAPYLSGELSAGQIDGAQNSPALARSFLDLLLERIERGENNFLHLLVYSATRYPAADLALERHAIIARVVQTLLAEDAHRLQAHAALQVLVQMPKHYEQLLAMRIDEQLLALLEKKVDDEEFAKNDEYVRALLKSIFDLHAKSPQRIEMLEEKLFQMIKKFKQNKFFVDKILLSFFEFKQPRLLRFVDVRPKESPSPVAAPVPVGADALFPLKSTFLTAERLVILTGVARELLDDKTLSLLSKGVWQKEIETSFENEDFSEQLEQKLFANKPLLFVVNGENNGNSIALVFFAPTGFVATDTPNHGRIPNSANAFISTIEGSNHVEYKLPTGKGEAFLEYVGDDPSNKAVLLMHEDSEKIRISMGEDVPSVVDLYPLKPVNELPQNYEFPYDLHINSLEVFAFAAAGETPEAGSSGSHFYDQLLQAPAKHNMISVVDSIFSDAPIFELPGEITVRGLEVGLKTTISCAEKQKMLKEFAESPVVLGSSRPIASIEPKDIENHYNPRLPLFDVFIEKGGMRYLIQKIMDSDNLELFKTPEVARSWKSLMKNLLDLEALDGFLSAMIQNKDFFAIIFELFVADKKSTRDWVQTELSISWLILQKLANMLSNSESLELRVQFLRLNVLQMMLEKLASLTNEIKRRYDESPDAPEPDKKPDADSKEENYAKEVKKRKGVGYEKEGSGKKWIVTDYLAKKKQKTDFMIDILRLFKLLFDRDYPGTPEFEPIKAQWSRQICESCFLPLLEGAFKCSSLHEMAKDYELYKLYCDVVLTFADRKELRELLKPIPKTFKPNQLESLLSILLKQEENTLLFKKFSDTEASKKEKIESMELAEKILSTITQVKALYADYLGELEEKEQSLSEENLHRIEELPLNDKYKLAMTDMRFGLANMKVNGEYVHHYGSNLNAEQKSSSTSRGVRLAQEIADLTASLPVDSYNAIFVRSDENRLDLMKALIAGAEGTPYANGLFEYHVYLPAEYPNSPPKCNLETTGSGDVRFNPNLYSCGKVCLSLLGTWRGNASENWDPKISNLLQLFLSIQSVVMSEEVYFNEPGYEHEAGTDEGEHKNEAYSNIVRYGNIKFAMIGQIKKPSPGFEDVVRRHFYVKREVILKECAAWVKMAEVRKASYSGLVSDHNHKYAQRFAENAKNYQTDLQEAIRELEKTFKELVDTLEISTIYASKKRKGGKKKQKEAKGGATKGANTDALLEKIDVTYDKETVQEEFDASSTKVADRWSRYIGVLGMDAVKKQSKAKVLLAGVTGTGLEVAKNLVLSGLNRLELVDWNVAQKSDLAVNFYVDEGLLGTNRALAVLQKLRQLNCYVKVDAREVGAKSDWAFVEEFDLVVVCDLFPPVTDGLLATAGQLGKKVIVAEACSVFSRIFCDFGDEFVVNDRDGEEPAECFIKELDYERNCIVLLEKSTHILRVGDFVQLDEVVAKPDAARKPLNKAIFTVKDFKKITEIEVVQKLSDYEVFERNGKMREIKVPTKLKFKRFSDETCTDLDQNLAVHDFAKMEISPHVANCFKFKQIYERKYQQSLRLITQEQLAEVLKQHFQVDLAQLLEKKAEAQKKLQESAKQPELSSQAPESGTEKTAKEAEKPAEVVPKAESDPFLVKLKQMIIGSASTVHSIAAFVGGVAAQEAIKGITNKYMPISQTLVCDFEELLDEALHDVGEAEFFARLQAMNAELNSSGNYYLREVVGAKLFEAIRDARLFMVGAGAIGCELLKNLAMMRFGSGQGQITLTDPDNIELSNLSRQFLFREKHISKPKALVAAKVIESMSGEYGPGRIVAKLDKVCEETEDIFTNEFFRGQTMCLNALDNIRARVYMDQRCVRNSVPLLESGTLGPKCHLQVIVPFLTENYGQVQDAKEEGNIPICTLKMFPEEAVHSMEWAKDKFEDFFNQRPKNLARVCEELKKHGNFDALDFKVVKNAAKFLKNQPQTVEDCVALARKWFQKYFYNNVRQLLHVYPLDFKTKDGKFFWTLPKRPPRPIEFDAADPLHLAFITAAVRLTMSTWGLDPKLLEGFDVKAALAKVKVEPFVPKDSAAAQIKKSVEKTGGKEEPEEESAEDAQKKQDEQQKTAKELATLLNKEKVEALGGKLKEEIFEKDDDKNGHVDFITAMTNLRSRNYQLPEMEWITVKLKAGRIVPALATTTAAIAGLQTVEAIKLLKHFKLEKYKNVFMNLSVPIITMSEPGPVVRVALTPELKVSVWDIWAYDFGAENRSLKHFFDWVRNNYKITPKDVMKGSKPVFLSILNKWEEFADKPLDDLLDLDPEESVYVTLVCYRDDPKQPLENVPPVKVTYRK